MDFPHIIAQTKTTASWLTPAAFLIALFTSSWSEGHGELLVHFVAYWQSDEDAYRRPEGSTVPREAACAHPTVRLRWVFI